MTDTATDAVSFNEQLRTLAKRETISRAKRFKVGSEDAENIAEELKKLRSNVNASVSRVREKTGNNFRVESGSMLSSDHAAIFAVVNVTRL
jgi:hypothetical protein